MFPETRRGRKAHRDPLERGTRRTLTDVSFVRRIEIEDEGSEIHSVCPECSPGLRVDYSLPRNLPYGCDVFIPTSAANVRVRAVALGRSHHRFRRSRSAESTPACNKESSCSHSILCQASDLPFVCSRSSLFMNYIWNFSALPSPATRSQRSALGCFEAFGTPSSSQRNVDTPLCLLDTIHDAIVAGVELMHEGPTAKMERKLFGASGFESGCKTSQACVQIALGPCQEAFAGAVDCEDLVTIKNIQPETNTKLDSAPSGIEVSDEEICLLDDSFSLATFGWDTDHFASEDSHTFTEDVSADNLLFCGESHAFRVVPREAQAAINLQSATVCAEQRRSPKTSRSLLQACPLLTFSSLDLSPSPTVGPAARKCFCRAFNIAQGLHGLCHEEVSPQGKCSGTHCGALLCDRASVVEGAMGISGAFSH
ncbi:hypothetical protein TGRUB_216160 [Toxoplasma gondii RUB]|uniref:Uncharacterized protein n=3 Tax=Toxoplasma gondii TaxID=5811 RepID=A0A086LP05_TOXGO|nr:hypothetical protein TGP89_216160 [Toxoplasma gondii p89]KFG58373.1 hypothetical protein TGRUB_216160 [Toxoplasma gondii RUB]RQX67323.1 hypothetical protein TGCAST_216160 [Toxoplasma gondii CAST]